MRDYIHVEDLARAHLDALDLPAPRRRLARCSTAATATATACAQVLDSVQRVSGKRLTIREEPRRAGDPPVLVARAERIRAELGWKPRLDDLDTIVRSSLRWEQQLLREPW